MILGCKRIHKPSRTLPEFLRILWSYANPKSNLHHRTEISSMASLNPKSSISNAFSKTLYWLIFFKKNAYFERKFIKYLMELRWVGTNHLKVFEKWMLWVVSFSGVDVFLLIWILFALDFYFYILSSGYRNRKFSKKVSKSLFTKKPELR